MTRQLYRHCPPYRERLDEVDRVMRPHLGCSVASLVLDQEQHDGSWTHDPTLTQPALFAVEYALATALQAEPPGPAPQPGDMRGVGAVDL